MSAERTRSPTQAAALVGDAQRGVIDRPQLRSCGFSNTAITRQIATGRLHPKWPGVFAIGHPHLTREGWWWAALRAAGEGSLLAGRAAAAVWRLLPALSTIDVIVPGDRGRELNGIRAHQMCLDASEITEYLGFPVTSIARTALDVAAWERPERVPEFLDHSILEGWYDHDEMLSLIARRKGHRGMGPLQHHLSLLDEAPPRFRSRAERRARDLIVGAGLLVPVVNAWFPTVAEHGYELDLWWPQLRLNVEIDGSHHAMPFQAAKDRLRDADLRTRGIRVERVPTAVVDEQPARFVREMAIVTARRT